MLDPDDEFVECWNEYRILMTIACSIQAVLAALAVFFIFYTPLTMHKPITGHHLHTVHTQAPNARIPPPVMTLPDKQSQIGYCRTILASELPKPTVAADRAVSWAEFLELEPAVEYPSAPIRVADTSPMAWFKDPLKGIPNRPKGVVMRLKIIEGLFAQQYPSKFRTQHGIAEHFPLPQLPILISNNEHYCFFGKEACAQAVYMIWMQICFAFRLMYFIFSFSEYHRSPLDLQSRRAFARSDSFYSVAVRDAPCLVRGALRCYRYRFRFWHSHGQHARSR
jgi:hypothetical protein